MLESVLRRAVAVNNERISRSTQGEENPLDIQRFAFSQKLIDSSDAVRREWNLFMASEGRLPEIGDVLGESQGNTGDWNAGILIAHGDVVPGLSEHFLETIALLKCVDKLQSALFSVLAPGTELPAHHGPNKGVLRFHLTICSNGDSALRLGSSEYRYVEDELLIFDDTCEHSAWNRGDSARVTLFGEFQRPVKRPIVNSAVQKLISYDRRYRLAPIRAAEYHAALNGVSGHSPQRR